MVTPTNPKVLVFNRDGLPAPKAKVFFYERGTDVPKSAKYVEGGTLTAEITADDSGKFAEVELLEGDYTLKSYIPLDPKAAYPLFPDDYELLETWDLTGAPDPSEEENDSIVVLSDLNALRNYDGDKTKALVGDRLFIKDTLVSQVDNNGTIVVSTALDDVVWRMDLTGFNMTSLDWFGPDKTGTTDSTATILTAISAIYNNSSASAEYKLPNTLFIPNGTYLINSDISFTCEVFMEPGVKFYNTTAAVDLAFNCGLETDKTDLFHFTGTGLEAVIPTFPQRLPNGKIQRINLQWYSSGALDGDNFEGPVDIIGEGSVSANTKNVVINKLEVTGALALRPNTTYTVEVKEVTGSKHLLRNGGTGTVIFGKLQLSYLYNQQNLNQMVGSILELDEDLVVDTNLYLGFDQIIGTKLVKAKIKNTTGYRFSLSWKGDVAFNTLSASVHDIDWQKATKPADMDWTGADSDDWNSYLLYGSNDFTGTTTSGDITISSDSTIKGLNHSGSFIGSGSLILENCKISITSGDNVGAPTFKLLNSELVNDSPSNGTLYSGNMRLLNSYITCPIYLTSNGYMQMEMCGCRFTNQVTVNQSGTLQTLVATHNEVGKADFIPYHFTITDFPSDVGISIDISDNWTTDLSGQLIRTKGIAVLPGSGAGPSTFEAYGFLDMLRPDGYSWAVNDIGLTPSPFGSYRKYIVGAVMPLVRAPNGSAQIENPAQTEQQVYCNFWTTQNWRPV